MKNNLEQAWKEEARKAYQNQQSQDNEGGCREPIGFVQGYIAAKKSDFEEIKQLEQELAQAKKDAEFWKQEYVSHSETMCRCQEELQKTREQLVKSNELLIDVKDIFQDKIFLLNINDSCFSRLRRWNNDSQKYIDKYFKGKDKQGE